VFFNKFNELILKIKIYFNVVLNKNILKTYSVLKYEATCMESKTFAPASAEALMGSSHVWQWGKSK